MTCNNILFFDFDGTLVDSMSRYLFYYNEYAKKHHRPFIDHNKHQQLRKKSLNVIRNQLGFNLAEVFFIGRLLKKKVYQNPELIEPFSGIPYLLKMLKKSRYSIYIISSNTKKNIQKILAHHNINEVDKIIHTYRGFNKTYSIKKCLRKIKNFNQVFVISDEYKDIKSANKLNLISVAVNWGANHFEANDETKPDFIVNSTEELLSVILQHNQF